jgi:hypothetical protein
MLGEGSGPEGRDYQYYEIKYGFIIIRELWPVWSIRRRNSHVLRSCFSGSSAVSRPRLSNLQSAQAALKKGKMNRIFPAIASLEGKKKSGLDRARIALALKQVEGSDGNGYDKYYNCPPKGFFVGEIGGRRGSGENGAVTANTIAEKESYRQAAMRDIINRAYEQKMRSIYPLYKNPYDKPNN